MWVLADLFSYLPEVGDVDKPKLVFFFDEAHLLFKDASKAFMDQVEQTVKLIRSRASACSSAPSCPPTFPMPCCRSWVPASSTRCGRSPRRSTGTDQNRADLSENRVLRSRFGSHRSGHRRAIVTVLSSAAPHAGGVDPAAIPAFADGHHRPGLHQGGSPGQSTVPQIRPDRRSGVGLREVGRPDGGTARGTGPGRDG